MVSLFYHLLRYTGAHTYLEAKIDFKNLFRHNIPYISSVTNFNAFVFKLLCLVTALLILGFDNLCVAKVPGPFSFVHCSFVLFFCAVCYTVEDGNFSAELIWRRRLKDSFDLQFKLSQ